MSNNKENNMKLHDVITKMWTDIKAKFGSVETDYKTADTNLETLLKKYSDDQLFCKKNSLHFFPEQETTGAYADRTLFSELAIPKGYAIVGGTGGIESAGQVGELPIFKDIDYNIYSAAGNGGGALKGTVKSDITKSVEVRTTGVEFNDGWQMGIKPLGDLVNKGKDNLAKGIEIVDYVYTALKDITNGELKASDSNGPL